MPDKKDRKNASLYCSFRNGQYALYDQYAKSRGILMNTFFVLNVLFYKKDGMTQKEICESIHHSKQTVSLIVRNLEKSGYAVLKENPEDKRNRIVKLTGAGRNYAEKPVRHISEAEDKAMSMFTDKEQETLISLSRRFTENLTKFVKWK